MIVYRIVSEKYALDLSGNGAKINGGRWNSEGIPALYASSHISLAYLEILVNGNYDQMIKVKYKVMTLDIPDESKILFPEAKDLPLHWDSIMITTQSQRFGDIFLNKQQSFLLKVPSAIVPEEHNYIINPLHIDIAHVKVMSSRNFYLAPRMSKGH